jgi:hypothetical protein
MRAALHVGLLATTVLLGACASDGTTSPAPSPAIESRLVAQLADAPSVLAGGGTMSMRVTIQNNLTEQVSGGVCAQTTEARATSGTAWTDVTATNFACTMQAAIVNPGATTEVNAMIDAARLRSVAGGARVVIRVRHQMVGSGTTYTLQSTEREITVP